MASGRGKVPFATGPVPSSHLRLRGKWSKVATLSHEKGVDTDLRRWRKRSDRSHLSSSDSLPYNSGSRSMTPTPPPPFRPGIRPEVRDTRSTHYVECGDRKEGKRSHEVLVLEEVVVSKTTSPGHARTVTEVGVAPGVPVGDGGPFLEPATTPPSSTVSLMSRFLLILHV